MRIVFISIVNWTIRMITVIIKLFKRSTFVEAEEVEEKSLL